jgi:hypothetical protein
VSGVPWLPAEHNYALRLGFKANEPGPVRVVVRRLVPGCWEVSCPGCTDRVGERWPRPPLVAMVATWERAMLRAGEHVREVHGD